MNRTVFASNVLFWSGPPVVYCVAGKVNSTDKLYYVIESVRLDTKRRPVSSAPVYAHSAGGFIVR